MKKYTSLLLISVLILLSGCGITVTKIENTTADEQNIITDESTISSTDSVITSTTGYTTTASNTTTAKITTTAHTSKPSKVTTTKKQEKTVTCTIEIECKTILNNLGNLRPEKKAFLPKGGYILKETTVSVAEGSTVFDVLRLVASRTPAPRNAPTAVNREFSLNTFTPPAMTANISVEFIISTKRTAERNRAGCIRLTEFSRTTALINTPSKTAMI